MAYAGEQLSLLDVFESLAVVVPESLPEIEVEEPAPSNDEEYREPLSRPTDDSLQLMLLDLEEPWRAEWHGMPEFVQEDLTPRRSLLVHFESDEDVAKFSKIVEQAIGPNLKSIWYPEAEIVRYADKRYADE